jgi:hypothetical protein
MKKFLLILSVMFLGGCLRSVPVKLYEESLKREKILENQNKNLRMRLQLQNRSRNQNSLLNNQNRRKSRNPKVLTPKQENKSLSK